MSQDRSGSKGGCPLCAPRGCPLGIHTHMYFQYMCAPYARALPPQQGERHIRYSENT